MKTVEFKLAPSLSLEMMEIPAGNFWWEVKESEMEKRDDKTLQHEVNLQPFYFGKFPVTQSPCSPRRMNCLKL